MSVRILHGDCRDVLKGLPDQSVQCCVTSPPYYGLRSYLPEDHPDKHLEMGLEATPGDFVDQMVSVFSEVRRVLRDDGTLWLNLGDSYAGSWGAQSREHAGKQAANTSLISANQIRAARKRTHTGSTKHLNGLKPKDRMMIPARVAIALQDDGWWLRDEIVWHKPRPTPNPVKDRTVCAHEMVYLLSKSAQYFFDWEAIEEPSSYPGLVRKAGKAFRDMSATDPEAARKRPGVDREITVRETRRARSVWSISPSPYRDGHFATMPPDLAERCIRAGTRVGDIVLDPFGGAGTTAIVADRLQRGAVLIELNSEHTASSGNRIHRDAGLFAEVTP